MARIGQEEGLCESALDSVAEHLAGPYGIVLQQPPYAGYHPELGEISSYPPGYKENAGIFCRNNPWIMIAEAIHGRGDRAYDYYKRIAPAFLEEIQDTHRAGPYVYAQMIAGPDAPHSGQAKNSWLTGTASWNYVAISQYLLGVRPEHDGLSIFPLLLSEIGPYQVTRKCRGVVYDISVSLETAQRASGLYVDDVLQNSDVVPYASEGERVSVECVIAQPAMQEATPSEK